MSDASTGDGLRMSERLLSELLAELAARGGGRREAGAFLLAARHGPDQSEARRDQSTVITFAYYDDLDPNCLTGGITFDAAGYTVLNALCRKEGAHVVGDIHTHPRTGVAQSPIDSSHPMAAIEGHVALIAPNYARGPITIEDLGAHVFHHDGWTSHFGRDVTMILTLTTRATIGRRLLAVAAKFRRALRLWKLR